MKILFITNDSSRTGAPIMLLNFLKWIGSREKDVDLSVIDLNPKDLKHQFRQAVHHFFAQERSLFFLLLKYLGFAKTNNVSKSTFNALISNSYDLIYANTVVAVKLAVELKKNSLHQPKLIAHIHELDNAIEHYLGNFSDFENDIDLFIAASELVKSSLIKNRKIAQEKIKVIHECSSVHIEKQDLSVAKRFIVGGSGLVSSRKGTDLFIRVAREIKKHYPNYKVEFVWVGYLTLLQKVKCFLILKFYGIFETITLVGQVAKPAEHYKNFSVFLLTSREDPFPLVCIENGMLGKPIVCFEGTTGTTEVVSKGGGFVVPYLDVSEMAKKVIYYYENRDALKADGIKANELFSAYTPDKIYPKIWNEISEIVNSR